jgi:lipoprotein-releasing system permease protein
VLQTQLTRGSIPHRPHSPRGQTPGPREQAKLTEPHAENRPLWYVSDTLSYALSVGLRYLRSPKQKTISVITVIAVAGVALGVGALLSVMAITSGFQDAFRNKILGVNAHVLVLKYGLDFSEYDEVVAHAEELPEVMGAAPFVIHEMMFAKGDRLSNVLVKGIDPERMQRVLDLPAQMVRGSLEGLRIADQGPPARDLLRQKDPLDPEEDLNAYLWALWHEPEAKPKTPPVRGPSLPVPPAPRKLERGSKEHVPTPAEMEAALNEDVELPDDAREAQLFDEAPKPESDKLLPGVIVGAALAENLGLELGDVVRVVSPLSGVDTSLWRDGGAPSALDFRVTGVFQAGFQEYDSRLVYVDLHQAMRLVDRGDTATGVELRLSQIEDAPRIARQLEADLGGGPYHTMDWRELNHNLFTALEVQKVILSLVIATIIFVAAFNVIATLIMVVLEKKREIAILKAMGAKDASILAIFLVQGLVIGLVGTLIGIVIGGALTGYLSVYHFPLDPKVYLIDHLPVRISAMEFVNTVLIALSICVAAGLVPSYWAARLLPAEGVRYE